MTVPAGTVGEVLAWVGDDPGRAGLALEVERARIRPRRTLLDALEGSPAAVPESVDGGLLVESPPPRGVQSTRELGADLSILVPMLGRPHRVRPLLESIWTATPRAEVVWLTTPTDRQVIAEIDRASRESSLDFRRIDVPYRRGDYPRKINVGYRQTSRPLLFTGACDLRFAAGWLAVALAELVVGIGVVGTSDGHSPRVLAGEHATHSLVTRWYADSYGTVDQPGAIFHDRYWHEFCDDELVQTAMARGAWAFAPGALVEHLHPDHGLAPDDQLYRQRPARMRQGRALFRQRERLWT